MAQKSRKGAQAFATGNFEKGLNGVLGTINAGAQKVGKKMKKDKSRKGSRKGDVPSGEMEQFKKYGRTLSPLQYGYELVKEKYGQQVFELLMKARQKQSFNVEAPINSVPEGATQEQVDFWNDNVSRDRTNGYTGPTRDGSRKGSGPLCDLGSVSGKGSRPENLGEIATKVALGRNRSIGTPTAVVEEPTTEAPEEQTREGGFLRSVGKVLTNGAKVVGNGIHAAADELVAGGKDALNDKSTDFENVAGKIKNTPGGTSDEAAEKAGTPAGAQAGSQSAGNQDIASRVMNGEFGNGAARTKALTDAGYDPQEVQSQVNSRLKSKKGSRKGSRKGFGFGYNQVVLHEISPKQITSIPGGGVVNHEGQVYKIERLPEFEPNEWIHKLVLWTDPDPDSGWDYTYDYCDWE